MLGRLKILNYWILKNKNKVSVFELMQFLVSPSCKTKALKFVEHISEEENFFGVRFKGLEKRLFFPKRININQLYLVVAESFVSSNWHYYEIPETKILPNDIVLDCGAAEGLFSLIASYKARQVYTYEPAEIFWEGLNKTFASIDHVKVFPLALGAERGEAFMSDNGLESSISQKGNKRINIDTIDNLFYHKGLPITYIKADLEGYEMKMLKGAKESIKKFKPKIAITTYHEKGDAQRISSFLLSLNKEYKIKAKGINEYSGEPVMLHAY